MSNITGITRGGVEYTPEFIMTLDQTKCIGCGRCFKTCPRDVFDLVDRDDLDLGDASDDDDWNDGDGFSDDTSMVMSLKDPMDCIGCKACIRVCPKGCMTHQPQPRV
jgi:Nif-specific ferredoxin III